MTSESLSPTVDPDAVPIGGPFSRVCAVTSVGDGRYAGDVSPVWTIGPKVHGGTLVAASAAAGLAALRDELGPTDMLPIAASTDFVGAPSPGAVSFDVDMRKLGRQICLADVTVRQGEDERVFARTALTFGLLDDDSAYRDEALFADMPAEPDGDALHYDERSGAAGTQMGAIVHPAQAVHLRLDRRAAAFLRGETGEPLLRLWIKPFDSDTDDPDVTALFAMMAADVSPPVPMNLGHAGWAPTVQLTTYLRRRPVPGWLRVITTTRSIGGRAFDEDHLVVDASGAVVAQSRQLALLPRG
jgi:acyl-CoA thioesterase